MKAIQLIRAIILLGFGFFIRSLLVSGDNSQYVHPRFGIALILAYCFFILLAVVQILELITPHIHQEQNFKREIISCILLAFPLVCACWLPASSLGSDMIEKNQQSDQTGNYRR